MAQSIREVMTPGPQTVPADASVVQAAQAMRSGDVGDVVVVRDGEVCGIITDRDIVVRAVAETRDTGKVTAGEICSRELTTLSATDSVEDAVRIMREKALRRLPIVDDGQLVGIASLGDLAIERDPDSALAVISAAEPNT